MSYIIEQLGNFLFQTNKPYLGTCLQTKTQTLKTAIYIQKESDYLLKSLGRFGNSVIASSLTQSEISVHLLLNNVYRHVSIILKINLNPKTHQFKFNFNLLNADNKFISISGKERRLLFCKVLVNRFYLTAFQVFKMTVNMTNGEIRIHSPVYGIECDNYATLSKLILHVIKIFSQNLNLLFEPLNFIKEINRESCKQFLQESRRKDCDERIKKIYYYSQFTNVAINLTLDSTNEERSIVLKHQKEIESIQLLKNSFVSFRNKSGVDLFAIPDFMHQLKNQVSNFEISFLDREEISQKTAPPCLQKSKNPHENNYVLNFIRMNKKLEEKSLKKINAGGFTNIYFAQIEYWYVGSYSEAVFTQPANQKTPPHKKYIIIKRQERLQPARRSRVAHEKLILKKIKNGVSLFLPKYYLNAEKVNDLDNELMADFIKYPTLSEFLTKNKETMTYQTKIYMGYIIAQGLRYLQEYQIVHLDLKPSNIMLSKNMMIKLIDFGQSYHPDIKNHQPGFSMPYSAPENYNFPATYDHKNDVFSLGIILHELFLSKYPFYLSNDKKKQECYRRGCVSDYWYCSPEQNLNFGELTIFPLLQLLIDKCLSPQPHRRPELEWIVLILRSCLDYLC